MNTIEKIIKYDCKPEIYEKSTSPFWDDDHISKSMLQAHFDQDTEAASRNMKFISQSVQWINSVAPASSHHRILDIGCGPGIYAEKFSQLGYEVVGIDISKRSIDYAKEVSKNSHSQVQYMNANYLEIELPNNFDLITFIYCDYGALSTSDRKLILDKIYRSLNSGGKLILDVFTHHQYLNRKESSSWSSHQGSGFFRPISHLSLEHHYIYNQNVRLNQYIILDESSKVDVYRIWDTCFTKDSISKELEESGFHLNQVLSDVSGKPYKSDSNTLAVIAEKK
ncbi:MAG: class I SAM-dependent methyltransferase [Acholeplasmataceae bacterium]|nr:class I SAM-dependent methyltransferase [Acholeplasmataceae bacterium]